MNGTVKGTLGSVMPVTPQGPMSQREAVWGLDGRVCPSLRAVLAMLLRMAGVESSPGVVIPDPLFTHV